jgi:hypothetical protein
VYSSGGVLSYQDVLRVLGRMLEESGAEWAQLLVSPQGVEVIAPGWRWAREWTMEMLRVEAARQARARNHPSYQDRRRDTLAGCLRVVGADLDQLGKPYYIVRVQPDGIQVQDRDGYEHSTDFETLKRRAVLAVQMR